MPRPDYKKQLFEIGEAVFVTTRNSEGVILERDAEGERSEYEPVYKIKLADGLIDWWVQSHLWKVSDE